MYGKELLKGNTETMLLALLSEEPKYGYQLVRELEVRSSGYFQFKEGTLYPALHRLEKTGLIAGQWAPTTTGQQRRYYALTDLGKKELARKSQEWLLFSQAVNLVMQPDA